MMQVLSEKESQICELQEQVTKLQSQPQVSIYNNTRRKDMTYWYIV